MSKEEAAREAARLQEQSVTQDLEASLRGRSHHHTIPPMPDHQPPAPPPGPRSPEGRETVERANKQVQRESSEKAPDRVLRTTGTSTGYKRDSLHHESILPVVQEAGESQSHYHRAKTPSRDKILPPTRGPPPTPPKGPDYTHARNDSANEKSRMSRESLRNKTLPPLPRPDDSGAPGGIRMVME